MQRNECRCVICQAVLPDSSRITQQKVCPRIQCKIAWQTQQQQVIHQKRAEEKAQYEIRRDEAVKHFVSVNHIDSTDYRLVEIPFLGNSPVAVSVARLRAFEDYLYALLDTFVDIADEEVFQSPNKTLPHTLQEIDTFQFCAACQGKCCLKGNKYHAFIQRHTLKRAFDDYIESDVINGSAASVSASSAKHIVDTYLSYVPEKSVANSCLYHTDKGCALPAHLKADICGDFFCDTLSHLINETVSKTGKAKHLVVVQNDNQLIDVRIVE